jgi:hypothetical protein
VEAKRRAKEAKTAKKAKEDARKVEVGHIY